VRLNEYQLNSEKYAAYEKYSIKESEIIPFLALGITGEAGEIANKIKKHIRGDYNILNQDSKAKEIALELGDVLWYVSELANCLGFTLDDIAKLNLEKLYLREQNNTIQGDGDIR